LFFEPASRKETKQNKCRKRKKTAALTAKRLTIVYNSQLPKIASKLKRLSQRKLHKASSHVISVSNAERRNFVREQGDEMSWEKNVQNVAQPIFKTQMLTYFISWKKYPKIRATTAIKKLPKLNNRRISENSPQSGHPVNEVDSLFYLPMLYPHMYKSLLENILVYSCSFPK
jgi:hypothetical protein